jgi:hypothetical protein
MKSLLLSIFLLSLPLTSGNAFAFEDLDETSAEKTKRKKAKKQKKKQIVQQAEIIREIERGLYAKAPVGVSLFLGKYAKPACLGCDSILRPGSYVALSVGSDFVDTESTSMAWEVAFTQAAHNGEVYEYIDQNTVPPDAIVQGDTRTFQLIGNLEWSTYPTRRIGVGIRAGGGVLFAPALVNEEYFIDQHSTDIPAVHSAPHPVFFGGPTFEYYTKLSHFSVGADIDIFYGIGLDIGMTAAGYFKYTF